MADGTLVVYLSRPKAFLDTHEGAAIETFARTLAGLKDFPYGGVCTSPPRHTGRLYVVADDTMLTPAARAFGIRGVDDFYGGVVPHPLLATKIIAHDVVDGSARRPDGWPAPVVASTAEAALPGFSVFDGADAAQAFDTLHGIGAVRLKPPRATGGRDQCVVRDVDELTAFLSRRGDEELHRDGLVLEAHLESVVTLSLGQTVVAGMVASYYGTQRSTTDNDRRSCYAGSDLVVVRGGWDELEALPIGDDLRVAISQTRRYDEALLACPGVLASRRNYDVAQGIDGQGRWRSGVLEHSWRIGGASNAEIAAVGTLIADPDRVVVRASTFEVYGGGTAAPANATVVFDGIDPAVGRMLCYTVVHEDGA
jgi:hypothetical protein